MRIGTTRLLTTDTTDSETAWRDKTHHQTNINNRLFLFGCVNWFVMECYYLADTHHLAAGLKSNLPFDVLPLERPPPPSSSSSKPGYRQGPSYLPNCSYTLEALALSILSLFFFSKGLWDFNLLLHSLSSLSLILHAASLCFLRLLPGNRTIFRRELLPASRKEKI